MKKFASVGIFLALIGCALGQCVPSITRVTGTHAPGGQLCSGQLLFEDNFDGIDTSKWFFANTMAGGGNWEFQWYPGQDPSNIQSRGGNLHLTPTLTSDLFGETFLTTQRVVIPADQCTQADWYGCDRQGTPDSPINVIRSTRIDSSRSFSFVYGEMEIRAKAPAGDWLWPALWLMPKDSVYGGWPRSGEIDLFESRGNRNLFDPNNNWVNVGAEQFGSTMHFGPAWNVNGWPTAHFTRNTAPGVGFNAGFHTYRLRWTSTEIQFFVDNSLVGTVAPGPGFWYRDPQFQNSGLPNPWANATPMAPFDEPFYIILNLAVGGTAYFADSFVNQPHPKPWLNTSPRAMADFWAARGQWLPTWHLGVNDDTQFQIDYVRVWAL